MFTLVVPFHSDLESVLHTLSLVGEHGRQHGIGEVLLCHNGAPLPPEQEQQVRQAAAAISSARLLHTGVKGLGAGYRLGIREATEPVVVLSASDLPFGFTDLEAFRDLADPKPKIAIGSKAHANSKLPRYSLIRRIASEIFYLIRRVALGASTPRDSQGTVILDRELARGLEAETRSDDYGFSVELITRAIAKGYRVEEIPVSLQPSRRPSAVSIHRDGLRLIRLVLRLRRMQRQG